MESHKKSKVFFLLSKSKNDTNNDSMQFETEPDYQNENEDGMDDFIASETAVKEESVSKSASIETVILSEHIAQKKTLPHVININNMPHGYIILIVFKNSFSPLLVKDCFYVYDFCYAFFFSFLTLVSSRIMISQFSRNSILCSCGKTIISYLLKNLKISYPN